jgi:hypothetical protein
MRALLFAGLLTTIWSVDPRGIWKVLTAPAVAFIKDYINITLMFCAFYYLDVFCRIVFESLGRNGFQNFSKWLTCGLPLIITIIVQVATVSIAIRTNMQLPRTFMICFLAFLVVLWSAGISISLLYVYSIRMRSGLDFTDNQTLRKPYIRLMKMAALLWVIAIAGSFAASLSVRASAQKKTSFEAAQVVQDPSRYEFYEYIIFYIIGVILVYLNGKIVDETRATSPPSPAARPVSNENASPNLSATQ